MCGDRMPVGASDEAQSIDCTDGHASHTPKCKLRGCQSQPSRRLELEDAKNLLNRVYLSESLDVSIGQSLAGDHRISLKPRRPREWYYPLKPGNRHVRMIEDKKGAR
jgi:hypothetical protein